MARTFRGRWGISGPQAGYNTISKARKPGGRVTKEGLFPDSSGHVLSLDEEDSKYRKSAKTGAARIERMTAAERRKLGVPITKGEADDNSEDLSEEEEVEVDEDEDELDSNDLEEYETAKEKRKRGENDLFALAAANLKQAQQAEESEVAKRRRTMADAALKRSQSQEVLVIDIDTSDDSEKEEEGAEEGVQGQQELEEWLRTSNAPPHIRKQFLATLKKSSLSQTSPMDNRKAKSTSKSQPKIKSKSGKRPLLSSSDSSDNELDRPVASSSKPKNSSPPPKRASKSGTSKGNDDDKFASRTYGAAAKLAVPRSLVRTEEFEDSDEEKEANAYKAREKKFQIHVPNDDEEDRRFLKETRKYEKLEKVTKTKKRKFKAERGPGYSNPRRN